MDFHPAYPLPFPSCSPSFLRSLPLVSHCPLHSNHFLPPIPRLSQPPPPHPGLPQYHIALTDRTGENFATRRHSPPQMSLFAVQWTAMSPACAAVHQLESPYFGPCCGWLLVLERS